MKIKHWQGYGTVNAKVIKQKLNTQTKEETITIQVYGNHEYGLDRSDDEYDVFNWLVKKLVKSYKNVEFSYSLIKNINFYYIPNIEDQEAAIYEITLNWDW